MDQGKQLTDEILNKLEKEINILYTNGSKQIKKELNKYIKFFDRINSITDKNKRLRMAKKSLEFELILKNIAKLLQSNNIESLKLINDKLIDIYILNFDFGAYNLEKQTLLNLGFTVYNKKIVTDLLKGTTPLFTKMAYLGAKDIKTILVDLRTQMIKSIKKGESINQIAKRVDIVTDKNNYGSIRIARTETTRITNSGRNQSFEEGEKLGLELSKQWISTIDSHTRDRHLHLNMKTVPLDKDFEANLGYPGDPRASAEQTINCRCTMVSIVNNIKPTLKEKQLDATLATLTFNEWRNRHVNES